MKISRTRGVTLVELAVALFLSTIVLTGIYGVWTRVRREMTRSNARQSLQNDLRTVSNRMQNDFKAIKAGTFEVLSAAADGSALNLVFERFVETEDGKVAQDSTERVEYKLANGLLTRGSPGQQRILSVNIETLQIAPSDGSGSLLAADDEVFRAGRAAMLDLEIVGKQPVRGYRDEVFYIEKTSLVMRDEFHKATNPNYVSIFDLAQLTHADVMDEDKSQDASLAAGVATLTMEDLEGMTQEQLEDMLKAQDEMLGEIQESIDMINDGIDDTETGTWGGYGLFSQLWNDEDAQIRSDNRMVKDVKDNLSSKNTVTEVEALIGELEDYAKDKEIEFIKDSVGASKWNNLSQEDKDLYREAYTMRVQDRTIQGAFDKLEEAGGDDLPPRPPSTIDVLQGKGSAEGVSNTYTDGDGNVINISSTEQKERNAALASAYEDIDLGWMGEFGDEPRNVGIYNAAKSLISQGQAKIAVLRLRDDTQENRDTINKALKR